MVFVFALAVIRKSFKMQNYTDPQPANLNGYFFILQLENPADLYYQGIQPFMMTIVTVAVLPVGTLLFVKIFHDMSFTNVFQVCQLNDFHF